MCAMQDDWSISAIPPGASTPLIGRAAELAELTSLLVGDTARLITVAGPAGVGKTRLAVAVLDATRGARRILWCPLATRSSVDEALVAIAHLLGASDPARLAEHLRATAPTPTLLALDNVEHLLALAPYLAALIGATPTLTILTTSRAPLRLAAERVVELRPLLVPDLGGPLTPAALHDLPSVALLVTRARAALPAFQLSPANAAAVAALCVHLDGLPLAIELAAARMATLSPQAIVDRLAARLDLLAGGLSDLPVRQQTLRRTLDWSYELLSPPAQRALAHLAVFSGGCDLTAAEAVCAPGEPGPITTLNALDELIRHRLVQRAGSPDDEPRYRMLETVQAYAREHLEAAGAAPVHARHAAHFLHLAEAGAEAAHDSDQGSWLARLTADHANLRVALAWLRDTDQIAPALRLAGALGWFWVARDDLHTARAWLDGLLADPRAAACPAPVRARALHMLGTVARHQAAYMVAAAAYESALALWEDAGAAGPAADVLCGLAETAYRRNAIADAEAAFARALAQSRAISDPRRVADALGGLARVAWARGDDREATAMQEEALVLRRSLGDRYGAAWSHCALGEVARGRGQLAQAAAQLEVSVALFAALGQRGPRALALQNLAFVRLAQGELAEAQGSFAETLAVWRAAGADHGVALSLVGLAGTALATGEAAQAARLLGAAKTLLDAIGGHLERSDAADYEQVDRRAQALLGTSFAAYASEGQITPLGELLTTAPAPVPAPVPALTERERAVLTLVARGLSNQAIAAQLAVSAQTVAVHLRAIYRKLAVHSRTAAVHTARTHALIQ